MRHRILIPFLTFIVGFSFFISPNSSPAQPAPPQIDVVFRYDDFSERSDLAIEARIRDAFVKNRIPSTWSLIPNVFVRDPDTGRVAGHRLLTPERADFLQPAVRDGLIEIALHGWAHQPIADDRLTEFAGREPDEQQRMIADGKRHLESLYDRPVVTFVPPWESYDAGTIRALEQSGIRAFSSGDRGLRDLETPVRFLPMTCNLVEIERAVEMARAAGQPDPLIVVLFHVYDFTEDSPQTGLLSLDTFDRTLGWLADQSDVRCLTIAQACERFAGLNTRRLADYAALRAIAGLDPPFLPRKTLYYPTANRIQRLARDHRLWLVAEYAAFALAIGLLAFALARSLRRRPALLKIARVASLVLLVAAVAYALRDRTIGFKAASILTFLLGLSAGMGCVRVGAAATDAPPTGPASVERPTPGTNAAARPRGRA
jgi:peptidoglycan/xylan/chitin deacetylase (PgdA/CDA1 family)